MPPRVSLTMIVKNEEANLPSCLASVADLVDEIVIVDTGSTDRTKEVATSWGARVFDFAWIDDFAAARNEALRHARGDFVFWLDADDRIDDAQPATVADTLGRSDRGQRCLCDDLCLSIVPGSRLDLGVAPYETFSATSRRSLAVPNS